MPLALLLTGLAALVLVVAAGALPAVRLRGWWRLAGMPAAVGMLFLVAPPVLAVSVVHPPRGRPGSPVPADHGLHATDVSLRTADGVELAAWYVPSTNGAAVALLHGSGGNRSRVLAHAAALAAQGYGVLLPDARGHADSGGESNRLGWHGDADVAAAVDYLTGRPEVRPGSIGVVGLSMGGEQAIGAAAADPRIRAVVADGATARVRADDAWRRPGVVERVFSWMTEEVVDLLSSAPPPTPLHEAVAESSAPMLLVAGGEMSDEVSAARRLQGLAPSTVSVWVAPGAGHTEAFELDPSAWTSHVDRFLEEALA